MVHKVARFPDPNLERQVVEIVRNANELSKKLSAFIAPYSTLVPTDNVPDGSIRIVNLSGVTYLYARSGNTWVRVQLS